MYPSLDLLNLIPHPRQAIIDSENVLYTFGFFRNEWLVEELNAGHRVLCELKRCLDPNLIFNPGKLGLAGERAPLLRGGAVMDSLLTAKEVAALLQVNLSTVYLWVQQGHLPHICLSEGRRRRCIRFRREAIERWIEEREKPGTPGVLQTLKAALVFQIKAALTVEHIEARELELVERAIAGENVLTTVETADDGNLRLYITPFAPNQPFPLPVRPDASGSPPPEIDVEFFDKVV